MSEKKLLTIKQAAIELGKTRQWVARRCKDGSIQNTTLGSRRYISRTEISRILNQK